MRALANRAGMSWTVGRRTSCWTGGITKNGGGRRAVRPQSGREADFPSGTKSAVLQWCPDPFDPGGSVPQTPLRMGFLARFRHVRHFRTGRRRVGGGAGSLGRTCTPADALGEMLRHVCAGLRTGIHLTHMSP